MSFRVLWCIHADVSEKHAACVFVLVKGGRRCLRNISICVTNRMMSQCCNINRLSKRLYVYYSISRDSEIPSGRVTWEGNGMNSTELRLFYRCDVQEAGRKENRTTANRNYFELENYEIRCKFVRLKWRNLYHCFTKLWRRTVINWYHHFDHHI